MLNQVFKYLGTAPVRKLHENVLFDEFLCSKETS